jgi:hypothetical protein
MSWFHLVPPGSTPGGTSSTHHHLLEVGGWDLRPETETPKRTTPLPGISSTTNRKERNA